MEFFVLFLTEKCVLHKIKVRSSAQRRGGGGEGTAIFKEKDSCRAEKQIG